jgi:alkyl sulfatase BDS1-like metallo-beta-lactamase superfamily hydrolase
MCRVLLTGGSFLEYLGIRVHGPKAQEFEAKFDWRLTDANGVDSHRLTLSNGALNRLPGSHGDAGELKVKGDANLFRRFVEALNECDPMFNVVEP